MSLDGCNTLKVMRSQYKSHDFFPKHFSQTKSLQKKELKPEAHTMFPLLSVYSRSVSALLASGQKTPHCNTHSLLNHSIINQKQLSPPIHSRCLTMRLLPQQACTDWTDWKGWIRFDCFNWISEVEQACVD